MNRLIIDIAHECTSPSNHHPIHHYDSFAYIHFLFAFALCFFSPSVVMYLISFFLFSFCAFCFSLSLSLSLVFDRDENRIAFAGTLPNQHDAGHAHALAVLDDIRLSAAQHTLACEHPAQELHRMPL